MESRQQEKSFDDRNIFNSKGSFFEGSISSKEQFLDKSYNMTESKMRFSKNRNQ